MCLPMYGCPGLLAYVSVIMPGVHTCGGCNIRLQECVCLECVWCLGVHMPICMCIFVHGENVIVCGVHMCVFSVSVESTCVSACAVWPWLSQGLTDGGTVCFPCPPSTSSWARWVLLRDLSRSLGSHAACGVEQRSPTF